MFAALYILLFRIQHPQNRGGGVFNCLSGAKTIQFLTRKRPFLADFGRNMVFNRLSEAKKLNF